MLRTAIFTMALISGGSAAWLSSSPDPVIIDPAIAAAAPREHVLVAAVDLAPGIRIDSAALRWQPWPIDALNENYVTRGARPDGAEAFAGMAVRSPVLAGEPVHAGKLAPSDAGMLSVMLAQGSRAVAVRISADTTAGGFILPNDRVDVLHTRVRQGTDGQPEASSRAIIRKVRVLAIDQMIDAVTGSAVGKTATLELTPDEAEMVVAAEAAGAITLILRSVSDADEPDRASIVVEEQLVQAPEVRTIRVFRGIQPELVELN
ncbi:Flp pilus assembly protein CpaB (plasmid) [Paracoccus liaowanqingii]|uniref:Flp pilus assembly protein CpaB n=2 Tax=Paracoccus liaowanqingii TaxID=2560053 RepID=A0A4Y5SQR5_9RHOB|nr:Flp pilus assembly protein CpaB [Paracoccus liaowanqingii]